MATAADNRFLVALALVLREETGYEQTVGGPYVRDRHGSHLDSGTLKLVAPDGSIRDLPARPDGMAFDDHPQDPGGRTGMGILQREYDAWRRANGLAPRDVWVIADEELTVIYRRQYWDPCRCGDLEPGTGEFTFNTAVNCGVDTAARQLQISVGGIRVDGRIGDVTIDAANRAIAVDLVTKLSAMQDERYRSLRHFRTFGSNWLARNERVGAACSGLAQDFPLFDHEWNDAAPPDARTARAHEVPAQTAWGSSTIQASSVQLLAAPTVPAFPMLPHALRFAQTGKSLLSIEFLLVCLSDPAVQAAAVVTLGIAWSARHVIGERLRRLRQKGPEA